MPLICYDGVSQVPGNEGGICLTARAAGTGAAPVWACFLWAAPSRGLWHASSVQLSSRQHVLAHLCRYPQRVSRCR